MTSRGPTNERPVDGVASPSESSTFQGEGGLGRAPRDRRGHREAEVFPGLGRGRPAARGAHHEALTDEVGLGHCLDGVGLLPHGHRQGREPDRTSGKSPTQGFQDRAVEPVEAGLVDVEEA